jgi:hypothetical protein
MDESPTKIRLLEPGDVVMIDGKERTVKMVRGRYVEFTDGTEIGFVHKPLVQR